MIPAELEFTTEPNRVAGAGPYKLARERCLSNDVSFADELHPHRMRPWIIGNEYGPLCLVWASCEQDALDEACDRDMLAGLAMDAETYREQCQEACADAGCADEEHKCSTPDGIMLLGNASEPFDSEHAWLAEVQLTPLQERYFAEARGANAETLDEV